MSVQPGLCRTWSETPKTGFLTTRLIYKASMLNQKVILNQYTVLQLNCTAFWPSYINFMACMLLALMYFLKVAHTVSCQALSKAFLKLKHMQRPGTEAIRTQIQPGNNYMQITYSQNTKRTYGQPSRQLFPKRWPLSNPNRTKIT